MVIYGLNILFTDLEPVCCSMSSSNCCFLTCIQISQEAGHVAWYSHLFKSSLGDSNIQPGLRTSELEHACILSCFSCVQLFATLWAIAHQAPMSMGFSMQEYLNGFPCPPPGDFPNPGIEPTSLMSPAFASGFFTPSATWEA